MSDVPKNIQLLRDKINNSTRKSTYVIKSKYDNSKIEESPTVPAIETPSLPMETLEESKEESPKPSSEPHTYDWELFLEIAEAQREAEALIEKLESEVNKEKEKPFIIDHTLREVLEDDEEENSSTFRLGFIGKIVSLTIVTIIMTQVFKATLSATQSVNISSDMIPLTTFSSLSSTMTVMMIIGFLICIVSVFGLIDFKMY